MSKFGVQIGADLQVRTWTTGELVAVLPRTPIRSQSLDEGFSTPMFGRKFKLYLPFLAIVVAQAAFVIAAPSDAPSGSGNFGAGAPFAAPPTGADGSSFTAPVATVPGGGSAGEGAADPDAGGTTATTPGGGGTSATTAPSTGTGGGGSAPSAGAPAGGSGSGAPSGGAASDDAAPAPAPAARDTSHCTPEGKQFEFLLNAPACIPAWPEGADNGGATYPGVTRETIKIVQWEYVPNQAADSILATQGLATTPSDRAALDAAALDFINAFYETYGRELVVERVVTECPTSPQDVPKCKEEARRVIDMQPFMVVIGGVNYPEIYDEFARAGVMTLGGWHWPKSYFEGRRPYRFDLFADGDDSAGHVAEYYCKKMKGQAASHAGQLIHPSIGGRDTPRKVGILAPDRDTDKIVADTIARKLKDCSGEDNVVQLYSPDINEATGQANSYVQKLIAEGVTTVVCFCDPVVPVSLFQAMSRQSYYPEHLMTGTGLLDYDLLGRLYDQSQWVHAFGPGHLFDPLPFEQMEVSRMWRATGRDGEPCGACNLNWSYYALVAGLIHYAGPELTPLNAEAGVFAAQPYGGQQKGSVLVDYGPGDYGAISDTREVFWNPNRVSPIDGRPGAYETISGLTRYELGEWTTAFDVPASAQ